MARCSLVTPVAGAGAGLVLETLRSMWAQNVADWEHIVVVPTDAGTETRRVLDETSRADARVIVETSSSSSSSALADAGFRRATGDWVGCIDAGDLLHPDALAHVAGAAGNGVDVVYTDEDRIDADGWRGDPRFKPDWSPDRLRAQPYTGDLMMTRRETALAAGGIRVDFDGAHLHDLALRVTERGGGVAHVPEVLYHRRTATAPVTPGTGDATVRAVAEHLARTGFPAVAAPHGDRPYARLEPALAERPLVSIVIPTAGWSRPIRGEPVILAANCIDSIVRTSTYPNYEIVCVLDTHAGDDERRAIKAAGGDRLRIVPFEHPYDFSHKINVGVLAGEGDVLVLQNDDTEVITPDWIERMLMYVHDDAVGAVGARLYFGDGRLQHAGIIATGGNIGHCFYGFPGDHRGYLDNVLVPTNLSAVTAACLMTTRRAFDAVGGLSREFPLNYNDVDYCFKLSRAGYRVVYNPDAQLWHHEGASRTIGRVKADEVGRLHDRWGHLMHHDPFYNPNFLPWTADFATPVSLTDGTLVPPRQAPGLYWLTTP